MDLSFYISRHNYEVGGIEMFRCFSLGHVAAVYLEIRKQFNEYVKRDSVCMYQLALIPLLVWFTGMPFNSATLTGGTWHSFLCNF